MVAHKKSEYNHPYLTRQLIAYIGNKRRLLPFIGDVFQDLAGELGPVKFADLFAGSGSVSRLAKYLGFHVASNDWEPYAGIINGCHVVTSPEELESLFHDKGGFPRVLQSLNGMNRSSGGYISTYYSPRNTAMADYTKERLFYTRENGEFIDTVREEIENLYPGLELTPEQRREKDILLACLIYQAATHANTSGVFKAFHKGFGGHGKDALGRITAPMKLQVPVLFPGSGEYTVSTVDAEEAAAKTAVDICYLDPPYNQHQYGSNYHLLNTIVKWDKPDHPLTRDKDGKLMDKGGIRRDWKNTKSGFCYRETAPQAFRRLIDRIDARHIVLSYNTEGIIAYEDIIDILHERGDVDLYSSDYVKFRGGRQSNQRKTHNVEFLIVCTAVEGEARLSSPKKQSILRFFLANKIRSRLRGAFYPDRLEKTFLCMGNTMVIGKAGEKEGAGIRLETEGLIYFKSFPSEADFDKLTAKELQDLYDDLGRCCIETKREECDVLLNQLKAGSGNGPEPGRDIKTEKMLEDRLVRALRKIAHKKYYPEYSRLVRDIEDYGLIYANAEFRAVTAIAEKRFEG